MRKSLFTIILLLIGSCVWSQLPQGIRLTPSDSISNADLEEIGRLVGNKRIVFLGEVDHYHPELYTSKFRVLKYLHEKMGFDMVAFESGFYDLAKAEEEIKAGVDPMATYDAAIFPIWTNKPEFKPLLEYFSSEKGKLKVVGFDSQFSGANSFDKFWKDINYYIQEELKTRKKTSDDDGVFEGKIEIWLDAVEQVMSYDVSDDFNATLFNLTNNQIRGFVAKEVNPEKRAYLLQTLDFIKDMAADYNKNHQSRKTKEEFKASDSNVRDRLMAENLEFWLKKYPNSKFICWGANGHFSRNLFTLNLEELKTARMMGDHIHQKYADQMYSLFFIGKLTYDTIASLENQLKKDNFKGLVDLSNSKASFKSYCVSTEDSAFTARWSDICDGIYYTGDFTSSGMDVSSQSSSDVAVDYPDSSTLGGGFTPTFTVSGRVTNETHAGLVYVNFSMPGHNVGCASNDSGEYVLMVPDALKNKPLRISFLGYRELMTTAAQLSMTPVIVLEETGKSIKTVTITDQRPDAKKLMKKVIRAIETNYTQEPYTDTILIRDRSCRKGYYQRRDRLFVNYDDNGFQPQWLYMEGYTGYSQHLNQRIVQCDSTFTPIRPFSSDSVYKNHIRSQNRRADFVNMRNNNFLNASLLHKYEFSIDGLDQSGGEDRYIISFRCKRPTHRSTNGTLAPLQYSGYLLVNRSDLAITYVEATAIEDDKVFMKYLYFQTFYGPAPWIYKETAIYKKRGKYYYPSKLGTWSSSDGTDSEIYTFGFSDGPKPKPKMDEDYKERILVPYKDSNWQFVSNFE